MKACEDGKEKILAELIRAGAVVKAAATEVQYLHLSPAAVSCATKKFHASHQ